MDGDYLRSNGYLFSGNGITTMDAGPKLTPKITGNIKDIPPQDWDKVFPETLEGHYFLKTLNESLSDQFSFFYILVYEDSLLVGAAPCFVMDFPIDLAVSNPLKLFFNAARKIFPKLINPRVVFCGIPTGIGRMGASKKPGDVMEAISESLEKIAEDNKAAIIIFKDFTAPYDAMFKPLLGKGFLKIESFPYAEMDISFRSFEEYLATLSRASREGLKRKLKKVDGRVKIDLEVRDELDEEALAGVYDLYMNTYRKQEMGFEKLTPDFFRNISRNMPGKAKYFLWRIEGKLAAFALCLVGDEKFIDYYLGFDYEVANRYGLYFVRFRDLLSWCISAGLKKYEMGQTSYEPKKRLGFNFTRLYFYVKHRNRLLNRLVPFVGWLVRPENFSPIFKQI